MSTNIAELKAGTRVALKDMKPKDQVKHLLEQNKLVIQQALPKHMNAERLMRVAITSVTSNPKLLECYVPTLIGGIIQCSQMGLEPNTVLGHAYLVPFFNTKKSRTDAQVIIGYKGLIDLARRSGQIVSIAAHAVRARDVFEYEYGLTEKLRHVPASGERGDITHFYAVAHMKDGGHAFEVLSSEAVMKIRDGSQGKKNAVWKDHFEEMGRKTAIRRLAKYLPLSVEMAAAVALDDRASMGVVQDLDAALSPDMGETFGAEPVEYIDNDTGEITQTATSSEAADEAALRSGIEGQGDARQAFEDACKLVQAGKYDDARAICPGAQSKALEDMIENRESNPQAAQAATTRASRRAGSKPVGSVE